MAISPAAVQALTVQTKLEKEQSLFIGSIRTHHHERFLRRLKAGKIDINKSAITQSGGVLLPPLITAIIHQNQPAFDELMKQPNIDLRVTSGRVPAFLYAAGAGNVAMTRALIERGVDSNTFSDSNGLHRAIDGLEAHSLLNYGQWPEQLKSEVLKWYNQEGVYMPIGENTKGAPFPAQKDLPRVKYSGNREMIAYLLSQNCDIHTLDIVGEDAYSHAMDPFTFKGAPLQLGIGHIFYGDTVDDEPKIIELNPQENTITFQVNMRNRSHFDTLPILVEYDFTRLQKLFKSQKAKLNRDKNEHKMEWAEHKEIEAIHKKIEVISATNDVSRQAAEKLKLHMARHMAEQNAVIQQQFQQQGVVIQQQSAVIQQVTQQVNAAIDTIQLTLQPLIQSNADKAKVEVLRLHPTKKNFLTQLHVASGAFLAACKALSSNMIQRNDNTAADYVAKGFKQLGDALPIGGFIAKAIGSVISVITDHMELSEKRRIALLLGAEEQAISKGMAICLTERLQHILQILPPQDAEELTAQAIIVIGKTLISKEFAKQISATHRTIDAQQAFITHTLADAVENAPSFQAIVNSKIEKALAERLKTIKKQPALEVFFTRVQEHLLQIHQQLKRGVEDPKKSAEVLSTLAPLFKTFKNPSLADYYGMFVAQPNARSKLNALQTCLKSIALTLTEKVQAQLVIDQKQAKEQAKILADTLTPACFLGLLLAEPDMSTLEQNMVSAVQKSQAPIPTLKSAAAPTSTALVFQFVPLVSSAAKPLENLAALDKTPPPIPLKPVFLSPPLRVIQTPAAMQVQIGEVSVPEKPRQRSTAHY